MRWVWTAVTGAVLGLSVLVVGTADAEPAQPDPPTPGTSTSDELGDMVMDAIEHGGAAAPTTTPVPAPPR
jgi:hypothetical protein